MTTDSVIEEMIRDFVQNDSFHLNWSKYEKMGMSRRKIYARRRDAIRIFSYFHECQEAIKDLRKQLKERDEKVSKLQDTINAQGKAWSDAEAVANKF